MKNLLVSRLLGACCALTLGAATASAQNPVTGSAMNANPAVVPAGASAGGGTVYNIRDYGATGDGKTVDSDAVNKAIDAAEAHGGGTVYFPAGYYLCFSIHLKTNITLYLDQGSWIVAAETPPEVVALQPRGGRGGAGGGGGGAGAAGPRAGGGGGRGAPAPRIRGAETAATPPPLAPGTVPSLNDFPPPAPSQAVQDFLAKVPPGTHMYDLIEHNIWYGLPAWRQPAEAANIPAGQPLPTNPPVTEQYQDFGHCFWHNSLIWGDSITNVSIIGPGTIYGRGLSRGDSPSNLGGGNKSIALVNCRNVTLKDFTVWHGGWFCLLATGVDNFTISNVKVDTDRDGFDIDCCQNVHITDCTINSPNDDGLVLKSSYALGYARPTQNVTITGCQVSGFQEGTLLDGTYKTSTQNVDGGGSGTGRIKFGTESNGGFKNITISNCVFTHCRGLALESVDGAIIEDVTINNITMEDVVNSPIYIRLGHRLRGPPENTVVGAIRRVTISNVNVSNAVAGSSIIIAGTAGHPIEDVQLSDIRITYNGGGTRESAQIDPPEDESQFYPEPGRLGTMPAYGMFARHVNGLDVRNVDVAYNATDYRPAVVLDDVQDIDFSHFKGQHEADVPEFMLWNTRNFDVERSTGLADQHIDKMDQGVVAK
jgi:polygalacturonase